MNISPASINLINHLSLSLSPTCFTVLLARKNEGAKCESRQSYYTMDDKTHDNLDV